MLMLNLNNPRNCRPEKIYEWHKHILNQKSSGMTITAYVQKHNLKLSDFRNFNLRLKNCMETDPVLYQKRIKLAKEFQESEMSNKSFCERNNIPMDELNAFLLHQRYLATAEEMHKKEHPQEEESGMHFIAVQPQVKSPSIPIEQLMIKRNEIELSIPNQVKVTVSPNVSSEKLVKIMQFLQEL